MQLMTNILESETFTTFTFSIQNPIHFSVKSFKNTKNA